VSNLSIRGRLAIMALPITAVRCGMLKKFVTIRNYGVGNVQALNDSQILAGWTGMDGGRVYFRTN
jgi:hypothetical protein